MIDQLFMLIVLFLVFGVLLCVLYFFMVFIFGGCCWMVFSIGILIIFCVWLGFVVQDIFMFYSVFIIIFLLCGFVGVNFVFSMVNISFFFSKQKQGGVLGLNGGLGNMGVSVMQLVVLLVVLLLIFVVFGSQGVKQLDGIELYLVNVFWIWVLFFVIFIIVVWFGMNDFVILKVFIKEQLLVFKWGYLWIMSLLYLVIFGFFIGFFVGFVMLLKMQFLDVQIL